ncbi:MULTISPECIES: hypothetical protein [Hymenobacter]|uniref:Uncharacterized protein n=1 Tax=Hymenobacter profundi TaxID=1982110 RepID=A0ABS6WXS2_9BACT|nr:MULTISPECIES: hypothetical protein [Hymenobacter]MBW3127573.1 hypothetical protein [Hymenobacter profundi]QNE38433.1 hypothetical protein F1C16_02090 [Hymenobacter sp. NBH84]
MLQQLFDFVELNREAGNEDWNDTFAYWLLILHDPDHPYARNAEMACSAMSFQYDVEEQSTDVFSDEELIPSVFLPIAPVTLAFRWAPFPAASTALGQPLYSDSNKGKTLAIFKPTTENHLTGFTTDNKHFDFLLPHVCSKAIETQSLVLLVGEPGWDYTSDYLEDEPQIQERMRELGFVYTLRKPQDSPSTT